MEPRELLRPAAGASKSASFAATLRPSASVRTGAATIDQERQAVRDAGEFGGVAPDRSGQSRSISAAASSSGILSDADKLQPRQGDVHPAGDERGGPRAGQKARAHGPRPARCRG